MAIADPSHEEPPYPQARLQDRDPWIIDTRPLFEALLRDLRAGAAVSAVSQRFHNCLVDVFVGIARLLRSSHQLERVCLSGGTFQIFIFLSGSRASCASNRGDRFILKHGRLRRAQPPL